MKELEKTKRISISTVLFILVIVIGFLTFEKPTNVYKKTNVETLNALKNQDYLMAYSDIDQGASVLVDIRDKFDYSKSHIDNAINIPTADILNKNSISMFNELRDAGKTVALYGKNPNDANSAWMLLYQLGYDNIKILNSSTDLVNNTFHVKNYDLEKPIADYSKVFTSVFKDSLSKEKENTPKKIIINKKKKKRKVEGGC